LTEAFTLLPQYVRCAPCGAAAQTDEPISRGG
jgi:hypothetical protein